MTLKCLPTLSLHNSGYKETKVLDIELLTIGEVKGTEVQFALRN